MRSKVLSAPEVALPMSKQSPVLDITLRTTFDVPLHLIVGIEAPALGQASRQTQRHRSVVRPLARFEPERSPPTCG